MFSDIFYVQPTASVATKHVSATMKSRFVDTTVLSAFIFEGGEIPAEKLQALQRVLESDFCTSIREVYEHVYDTVDIGGSAEVRASATAKVFY